jgi:hypothetical protein
MLVLVKPRAVLEEAFACYRDLLAYLAVLAGLGYLAVALYSVVLVEALGSAGLLTALVLMVVGVVWITGLLVQSVDDLEGGEGDAWIGTRLRRLWPRINALSAGALLTGLALGLPRYLLFRGGGGAVVGLVLFVLAIYAMVRWAVWIPLVVIDGDPAVAALKRSADLTRGRVWAVFCVLFVQGVFVLFVSFTVGVLLAALTTAAVAALVSTLLALSVITPFSAFVQHVLYRELSAGAPAHEGASAVTT